MKIVHFADDPFVPAGHEDPRAPGVWKKVLLAKGDLQPGQVQMINWGRLPVGKQFNNHYHEDMQEIFVLVQGEAEIRVGDAVHRLAAGDTIRIDARETHQMRNVGAIDVDFLAVGITSKQGGRTVLVS
jgi:mannose-6-phosphate isomerase-like protein (cupin superfamily)